jgi:hypothetical protein
MPVTALSMLSVAVRQFGAGMLVAAVFGLAVMRIYTDLERKNELLIALVREQTLAAREVAENLRELINRIDK